MTGGVQGVGGRCCWQGQRSGAEQCFAEQWLVGAVLSEAALPLQPSKHTHSTPLTLLALGALVHHLHLHRLVARGAPLVHTPGGDAAAAGAPLVPLRRGRGREIVTV